MHRFRLTLVLATLTLAAVSLSVGAGAAPLAYVPNEKSATLSVIDTATATRIGDIAVGQLPWGVLIR
ncbi:hypothetical protein [Pseudoduganella umbonata]|uniref:YVTN family beta-propeller protein n=1 Tax=Pseudoduganella umbonata TaxID=864828 RepID=A0A4P8HK21_9BURK|nr:hypothetical protein [Pseudoduganella umbonata]MBB3224913.1 YVTN family beta-propeller protein [Pseudoduganella umbonata]QCP09196.1 hypothetical protein FCL38_01125 [Pseudoduganella umbonata]